MVLEATVESGLLSHGLQVVTAAVGYLESWRIN